MTFKSSHEKYVVGRLVKNDEESGAPCSQSGTLVVNRYCEYN